MGSMNLLVEDGEVEHADRIAAEMVLQALGVPRGEAGRIAGLPLPGGGWVVGLAPAWVVGLRFILCG